MSVPGSQEGEDDEVLSCQNLLSNTYERPNSDKKVSKLAIGVMLGQYDLKDKTLKTQKVKKQAIDEIQGALRNGKMKIGSERAPAKMHQSRVNNKDRG